MIKHIDSALQNPFVAGLIVFMALCIAGKDDYQDAVAHTYCAQNPESIACRDEQ